MNGPELLELSQTSEDLDIDLDITGILLDSVDVTTLQGFQYPAMVLTGVAFKDTLRVLKTRFRESFRSVDVWLDLEDGSAPSKIGTLPLELETLLTMRYLGINLTLYLEPGHVESVDLSSPNVLEDFI